MTQQRPAPVAREKPEHNGDGVPLTTSEPPFDGPETAFWLSLQPIRHQLSRPCPIPQQPRLNSAQSPLTPDGLTPAAAHPDAAVKPADRPVTQQPCTRTEHR